MLFSEQAQLKIERMQSSHHVWKSMLLFHGGFGNGWAWCGGRCPCPLLILLYRGVIVGLPASWKKGPPARLRHALPDTPPSRHILDCGLPSMLSQARPRRSRPSWHALSSTTSPARHRHPFSFSPHCRAPGSDGDSISFRNHMRVLVPTYIEALIILRLGSFENVDGGKIKL